MIMLVTFITYIKDNSQPVFTQLVSNSRRSMMCLSRDLIADFNCIADFIWIAYFNLIANLTYHRKYQFQFRCFIVFNVLIINYFRYKLFLLLLAASVTLVHVSISEYKFHDYFLMYCYS